jgi:CheY-like chemotaxis protein
MMRAYSLNYQCTAGQLAAVGMLARYGTADRPGLAEVEALVIVKYSHDARLIREALDLAGIEHGLTVTTDGLEALSFVRRTGDFSWLPRPDFIVLDLDLDKVSGRVVLDAIKMDAELCSLPVILLRGSPAEWNLSQGDDLRTCHFVSKPVDLDVLAAEFRGIKSLIRA